MKRRHLLQTLGTVGTVSLAGCAVRNAPSDTPTETTGPVNSTPAPTPTPLSEYAGRFATIVNLADRGADPTGERSIVDLLRTNAGDDTLLYLPAGTYLMDEILTVREFTNLGIVGDGARIVPEVGSDSILFDLGRAGRASDLLMEGLTFDISEPGTGPRPLSLKVGGESLIRDVSVVGTQDAGWGMVRIDVPDPDGVTTVERMRLPDGSTVSAFTAGIYAGSEHRGELRFVDCTVVGFANNGLYAQPDEGSVVVEGGYFANCGIASLRVGDNSVVRGAHVRCDRAPPDFQNMRGLRLREGDNVLVEDCLIEMLEVTDSDGGLVLAPWLEAATVRNTTIRVDADNIAGIVAKPPHSPPVEESSIVFENVRVEGSAATGTAVQILGRDNCRLENVQVVQPGAARNGILFKDTTGAVLTNASISVGGQSIVSDNSTVEVLTPTDTAGP